MASFLANILTFILFFLGINIIAFVHELGHFLFAKKAGIKVLEFGFGYPPRICGFYKQGGKWHFFTGNQKIESEDTIFSVNWLPLGAFNQIYSTREEGIDNIDPSHDDFDSKSIWTRFKVLIGGAFLNIVMGALMFYFVLVPNNFTTQQGMMFDFRFPFGQQQHFVVISQVMADSPALTAKILPEDLVISADGQKFQNSSDFRAYIRSKPGQEVSLTLGHLKSIETREVKILPKDNSGIGFIGAALNDIVIINYGTSPAGKLLSGFTHAFNIIVFGFSGMGYLIKSSFMAGNPAILVESMAGPVAIYAFSKAAIAVGFMEFFNLMALISVLIGFTNILPLPALDGGRICFLAYEAITRKKVPAKIEAKIQNAGFMVLMLLGFLIIFKDLFQFKEILFK